MSGNATLSQERVRDFLDPILGADLHAKRISSLADATTGALRAASLAVCAIGTGLAAAKGLNPKHAGKQVDRMLSNPGIDLDAIFPLWVSYVVGGRTSIAVALDWTDFDADGQATLLLSTLSTHGRATPLLWQSVEKRSLKNQRSLYERRLLVQLAEILPTEVKVCVIADRGFGDRTLYRLLSEELHFDYVIRFRGNIAVTAASGETRSAAAWVRPGGRARTLPGAAVTAERYHVGSVVCLRDAGMKQASRALRVLPPEDRFAMVSRHVLCRQVSRGTRRALRQTPGYRSRPARHQGPALRYGHGRHTCRFARAARQAVADQRFRRCPTHLTGRHRRGVGL